MTKLFSSACERNQQPILTQLLRFFRTSQAVLEIGSGSGQHAVFFAKQLTHLNWYTSDDKSNHTSIQAWMAEFPSDNLFPPIEFLVGKHAWPDVEVDAVFTANSTHIMQKHEAKMMMEIIANNLPKGGLFCQYGPFNIDGHYSSESNRDFDRHLLNEGCGGLRDINELKVWASGLQLIETITMPANNLLLVWQSIDQKQ